MNWHDYYRMREASDLYNRFERTPETISDDTVYDIDSEQSYRNDAVRSYLNAGSERAENRILERRYKELRQFAVDTGSDYRFTDFMHNRVGRTANPITETGCDLPYGMHKETEKSLLSASKMEFDGRSHREKYYDILTRQYIGEQLSEMDTFALKYYKQKYGDITAPTSEEK